MTIPDNTPVVVGVGAIQQKEPNINKSREPIALMIEAANTALQDCLAPQIANDIEVITVPKGMWLYSNPAALIAEAIDAKQCHTELADFGILQQSNIGAACQRIAKGELDVAMVVGGEAKFRQLQGHKKGMEVFETPQTDVAPDTFLQPEAELWSEIESNAGLGMPVGYYALLESAICHAKALSMDQHRDNIAHRYARFSEIAAANPDGWIDTPLDADIIRNVARNNKMLAFPYTKYHNSQWNVDQACALIFCSVKKAIQLDIPQSKWIYPVASTESNYIVNVSQRSDLAHSAAARIAGKRALQIAGCSIDDIDFIELYSCFPSAVNLCLDALDINDDRDLTRCGAMPFAGGPLNNFLLQSTVKMVQQLRAQPGSLGLASCVSGMYTKQGYGIWSSGEYRQPFVFSDVSAEAAVAQPPVELVAPTAGKVNIIAATVLYQGDDANRVIVIGQYVDGEELAGKRTVSYSQGSAAIAHALAKNTVGQQASIDSAGLLLGFM